MNFAKAPAYPAKVVDADLGINVDWVLKDQGDYEIKVVAELEYFVCDVYGTVIDVKTIQTEEVPITLKRDAGNSIDEARCVIPGEYLAHLHHVHDPEDYYKVTVPAGYWIDALMTPPESENFDLYLYDPNGELVASSTKSGSQTEYVCHKADSAGDYYIRVNVPGESRGLYKLKIDISSTPPGGCPFVSVWNGEEYVIDNNLLAASELSNGTDVEDYYRLEQTLIPKREYRLLSWHSLQISEFENEHSYIDQVKLLAVDHETDVHVAVSPNGEILTYKNPYSPIFCLDNEGNDVLEAVSMIDCNYYQGHAGDYLQLDFEDLDVSNGAKLILRSDQNPILKSPCIHIQVLNTTGGWTDAAMVRPRAYWATEIVDLSDYLPDPNGDLKVRLYFTARHKLDYVGLDTTPQGDIQIKHGHLASAIHSEEGYVTLKILFNDEVYAELLPNQQIKLTFILPINQKTTRTFILYINGRYHTITSENLAQ